MPHILVTRSLLRAAASPWHRLALTIALAVLFCALPIHAQQLPPEGPDALALAEPPSDLTPTSEIALLPASPLQQPLPPKNDRLFFLLPNYLTVENRAQVDPLTAQQKFNLSAKTMTDPVTVSFIGVIALIGQARNSDPTYGQGFRGYSKRYATFYADTGIGTLMTTSVFPTILRQDPRYFQLGSGGTWHRLLYSMSRIFVTRTDSGSLQFNSSEIVGNAVAAGISISYHPQSQRTLGNTLSVWGTDTMLNALCNVAKEFWPDLRRKIRKQNAD